MKCLGIILLLLGHINQVFLSSHIVKFYLNSLQLKEVEKLRLWVLVTFTAKHILAQGDDDVNDDDGENNDDDNDLNSQS